jgi:signal transduction histidine kinase
VLVRLRALVADPRGVVAVGRASAFGLCVSLTIIRGSLGAHLALLGILLVIAIGASLATARMPVPWMPYVEAAAAASAVAYLAPDDPVGLPYLLAPALEAGLLWGFVSVVTTVGIAAFALTVAPLVSPPKALDRRAYASLVAEWLVLSFGTGSVAAWVRRVRMSTGETSDPTTASYAAAYRLLSQLRVVSRQLSGGLDAYSLGLATLDSLRLIIPYTRAAVYARSEGGRLVPLAYNGVDRVDWVPSLDDDSSWAYAWTSGLPQRQAGTFSDDPGGFAAVLPLRVGVRVVGLVGVERPNEPYTQEELAGASGMVDEAALRIETALLFAEVRQIATAEERRRLAREIHDGIAQELASLGYVMDDLSYRAADDEQRESMQFLRGELTRIISELRLSIFDLRSEALASNSLGGALSEHVRTVGATSHLTVHIELDESPQRLRSDAETELMRIAQEAITNVRKHAGAQNLWVTVRTAPPSAFLRIEDDGLGLRPGRADSYGMEIMRERADRLGASLSVTPRDTGGTVVEVALGSLATGTDRTDDGTTDQETHDGGRGAHDRTGDEHGEHGDGQDTYGRRDDHGGERVHDGAAH